MLEAGDFIGNYRVIIMVARKDLNNIYLAEHTFNHGSLVLITYWPRITFATDLDAALLLRKVRNAVIQNDTQTIQILEAGMHKQAPYIVTENREQVRSLLEDRRAYVQRTVGTTKINRTDKSRSMVDVFVQALLFGKKLPKQRSATGNVGRVFSFRAPKKKTYQIIGAILALVLLIGSVAFLRTVLPASAATLTVTPTSKRIIHTYTIDVVHESDTLQPGMIKGHTLSYKTAVQSKTVPATGKGHHAAIQAHGKVIISQIHLFNVADNNSAVEESILDMGNGVDIVIGGFTAHEGGSVTVDAHAMVGGLAGDIGADSLDGLAGIHREVFGSLQSGPRIGTAYLQNPASFSGGQEAWDYAYVQQKDIDNVSNTFTTSLTAGAKQKTNQLMKSGEQLIQPITCSTETKANHKANDAVDNVAVQVDVKCSAEAYNKQDLLDTAVSVQKTDALTQFGPDYVPVGDITTDEPKLNKVDATGLAYYEVPTDGIWSFDINTERQQHKIAQSIAGRSQRDVMGQLLSQGDFKDVKIDTAGFFGTALPTSIGAIKFVVIPTPGLKQTV